MVADLLQAQQRGEQQPLAPAVVGVLQLRFQVADHRFIQGGLLGSQIAKRVLFHLVGQILDDCPVGLHAAQDKRPHQAAQALGRRAIAVAHDRPLHVLAKLGHGPQEAGIEHAEQRPQVHEPVLDGSAGQGDAPRRRDGADCLGHGRRGVLDVLGLVHDEAPPAHLPQHRCVQPGDSERGNDDVDASNRFLERLPGLDPLRPVVEAGRERRRETPRFALPVADHRSGCDEQRGPGIGVARLVFQHRRQHLNGLPQPHVVGQTCAETEALQVRQPGEAAHLVAAQPAGESGRLVEHFQRAGAAQRGEHAADLAFADHFEGVGTSLGAQQVGHRHGLRTRLGRPVLFQARHLVAAQLHPLPAQPDQTFLRRNDALPLAPGDRLAVHDHLRVEREQRVETQYCRRLGSGGGRAAGRRAARTPRRQAQTQATLTGRGPPRRHDYPEARSLQDRGLPAQEFERIGAIQDHFRGSLAVHACPEPGVYARGLPQLQQNLAHAARRRPLGVPGSPIVGEWNQQ